MTTVSEAAAGKKALLVGDSIGAVGLVLYFASKRPSLVVVLFFFLLMSLLWIRFLISSFSSYFTRNHPAVGNGPKSNTDAMRTLTALAAEARDSQPLVALDSVRAYRWVLRHPLPFELFRVLEACSNLICGNAIRYGTRALGMVELEVILPADMTVRR
jgi:hypothetical protein